MLRFSRRPRTALTWLLNHGQTQSQSLSALILFHSRHLLSASQLSCFFSLRYYCWCRSLALNDANDASFSPNRQLLNLTPPSAAASQYRFVSFYGRLLDMFKMQCLCDGKHHHQLHSTHFLFRVLVLNVARTSRTVTSATFFRHLFITHRFLLHLQPLTSLSTT